MDSLSDTTTESGHLAVTLITGLYNLITSIYNLTISLLIFAAQLLGSLILSLLHWSLTFWLGVFKLVTSPLTTAFHIVAFILSPVGYLFQFMLAPLFTISAIAIKLEPLYIFFSIAAILGSLTGLTIYLLTLPLSAILTTTPPPKQQKLLAKPLPTPGYTTDEETYFPKPSSSRRSSLDFDTDDANALQASILRPRQGPDLYAAWREKVGSARGGGSVSPTVTAVLPPPGGAGSGSVSKRRLPGLLFGTTIHEEEDDSL